MPITSRPAAQRSRRLQGTQAGLDVWRVELITGAAGGIGAATARLFAQEGTRLVLTDRDQGDLDQLAEEVDAEGARTIDITLDVASAAEWQRAIDATSERFEALDVPVNLAGILPGPGIESTDEATWAKVVAVNQTGTWLG